MVRIRNTRTLVEKNVPERAVKYFPGYEVVDDTTETPEEKPHRSRRTAVESDTTEE